MKPETQAEIIQAIEDLRSVVSELMSIHAKEGHINVIDVMALSKQLNSTNLDQSQ